MSPDSIRVYWSPPTEGAPVTAYRVNFTSRGSPESPASIIHRSRTTQQLYTRYIDFTHLVIEDGGSYTVTVEAQSEHLSGVSIFSTETESESTPGVSGDMNSTSHGDMNSTTHHDMNSTLHGDMNSTLDIDMNSTLHGDMNNTSHGDMNSALHGERYIRWLRNSHIIIINDCIHTGKTVDKNKTRDQVNLKNMTQEGTCM